MEKDQFYKSDVINSMYKLTEVEIFSKTGDASGSTWRSPTYSIPDALEACQKEHDAQFMPAIIDARIVAPKEARIWKITWETLSIVADGETKLGNAVVAYCHATNYLSNPNNIREAIKQGVRLEDGAVTMPQSEFQKIIDLDGLIDHLGNRLVWVIDYKTLRKSPNGVLPLVTEFDLERVLEHPQTTPLLGGRKRAESYLRKGREFYGTKTENYYYDGILDKPRGRILLANDIDICDKNLGFRGYWSNYATFIGIRRKPDKAEQILQAISGSIAPCNMKDVEKRIRDLFQ